MVEFCIGFIAGEGSFIVGGRISDGKFYIRPSFSMTLSDRDEEMLYEVKEQFNDIGFIHHAEDRGEIIWQVNSKDDLSRMRDIIEENAPESWYKSEKYNNFNIWSSCLDIYLDGRTTVDQQIEMSKLAKDLNRYNGKSKSEWENIIDRLESQKDEKYTCGESTGSGGECQRKVSSPTETCWDH